MASLSNLSRPETGFAQDLLCKDAHAEVILWEVRESDEAMGGQPHSVFTHYLKTKIFDQRGAEMVSKVDIPFIGHVAISDIAGRTTQANDARTFTWQGPRHGGWGQSYDSGIANLWVEVPKIGIGCGFFRSRT
jgi:hypothetical protein